MKTVLIVAVIAFLMTIGSSDSAAVRSEEFAEELRRIVHDMYPGSLRTERGTKSENYEKPKRNCYDTPCGWNTYNLATRIGASFMPNTCKCPDESYKCVRTGENVSMSAYVYHCRQNTTVEDIVSPGDGESPEYGS